MGGLKFDMKCISLDKNNRLINHYDQTCMEGNNKNNVYMSPCTETPKPQQQWSYDNLGRMVWNLDKSKCLSVKTEKDVTCNPQIKDNKSNSKTSYPYIEKLILEDCDPNHNNKQVWVFR